MRTHLLAVGVAASSMFLAAAMCRADDAPKSAAKRPFGIQERTPWTTSKIRGAPDPPAPYRTERVFEKLKFAEPLDLASARGTDRLFVAERYGKIYSFPNDPRVERAELFIDLGKVIYGLAFHPKFSENGYVYVTYLVDHKKELPDGTRVSRFQVRRDNPLHCDPGTEQLLLTWPSGGHNGGCLQFGPDGCLYIATGDSGEIADPNEAGQDLSSLPGSILRIDVDRRDADKAYAIPADNPFVGVAGARTEIWAFGLRQPWKMSFDRQTGDLWTGNVGQDLWEMIYRIERGGNYGWSITEGSHPFRPERKRGPGPIIPPIVEHDHANFRSITGGFVYRGRRLPELIGAYIYGDYDTGRIWMLRYDREHNEVTENKELVDSSLRLVGFAEDGAGELFLLDHMSGQISRLVPNPARSTGDFPRTLGATGLFASVADHMPAPGLIPYSVIAPQWCDGAAKDRYLGIPGDARIEFETLTYPQPAPGAPPGWKFPDGTVLVETLSLEMEKGNPKSRRRLETRILHHERLAGGEDVGDQYWQGYTYLWNDQQTDAVLLEDPKGLDRTYTIRDSDAPGGRRQQTWHFPSRTECAVCHNMAAKYVLGVQTLQMNQDHNYGGTVANQLGTLAHLNIFAKPLPAPPEELSRLVDYRAQREDLARRARSYLHANCSHCHRKWGGGNADFQLLATLDVSEMGTVGVRPGQGTFNIPHARNLAPGDPYRSVLFYRMAQVGTGRMPRIGSTVIDERGLRLVHDWIQQLPVADLAEAAAVAGARAEAVSSLQQLAGEAASPDQRARAIERLLASTSAAVQLAQSVAEKSLPEPVRDEVIAKATSGPVSEVRDLFERFLPEEQRTRRLGAVIDPAEILALGGNVEAGRKIFFEAEGVRCRNCHQIRDTGTPLGPDLSEIGKQNTPAQLLEAMLDPSKKIDPKYLVYVVETDAGRIHTGLLVEKSADAIVLKDEKNELIRIPAGEVALLVAQQKSLMPDLLLRDMTAREVVDLTAFLHSLK
ncbi:MAG: PQQ-dependent sugar dehydrogenase [Pirellulales bacterium]